MLRSIRREEKNIETAFTRADAEKKRGKKKRGKEKKKEKLGQTKGKKREKKKGEKKKREGTRINTCLFSAKKKKQPLIRLRCR